MIKVPGLEHIRLRLEIDCYAHIKKKYTVKNQLNYGAKSTRPQCKRELLNVLTIYGDE